MPKLKVYISSTFLDLQVPRDIIIKRVEEGLKDEFELTNIMEHMKGDMDNRADVDICLAEVRKADVYIILLGNRYGSYPWQFTWNGVVTQNKDNRSYTELEYDTACEALKEKFYGIYKLELTEDFFKDAGLNESYADTDPVKIQRLHDFSAKLSQTVSAIKINTGNDLVKTVNNKLTEFFLKYNTKIELDITSSDKVSIDRKEVLQEVQKLEMGAGAYTFLLEIENENDCYVEFTAKLQSELTAKYPDKNISFINSSPLAAITGDTDKMMSKLLKQSSINIYGDIQNGASFEGLTDDLKTIKNVFIGFVVDCKTDISPGGFDFVKVIASFINKIDGILKAQKFRFNFYFVIYALSPKNENLPATCLKYFDGLNFFRFGRLPDVNKPDVMTWLKGIKEKNTGIEEEVDALFKMIFLGDDRFPSKYKQCIELIDKRTK